MATGVFYFPAICYDLSRMRPKIRLPGKDVATRVIFKNYKINAFNRNIPFELTQDQFRSLIFQNCHYCSRVPSNTYRRSRGENSEIIRYSGIDRKDNSLGYFDENCVPCCKRCNRMKSFMDSEDFLEVIQTIISNQKIRNQISIKKLNHYHERAVAAAKASPDPSTKVGALLIHGESGAVIAEGYNGFVRGAPDQHLPTTRPEKYDYMIHAETNLICNAVRHGISTNNCVVYCTISPCVKCMRALYQSGITEVYVKGFYSDFEKCSTMMDLSLSVTTLGDFSKITIKPNRVDQNET